MIYSVNQLTTVAECDSLLTIMAKEKSDLEYRKLSLDRQKDSINTNGAEVDQELIAVTTEVTAFQTLNNSLPEGNAKERNARELKKAELRMMALVKKDRSYGVISLLTVESEIARTEKEIAEIADMLNAVAARKAAL